MPRAPDELRLIVNIARWAGVLAALGTFAFYLIFNFANPHGNQGYTAEAFANSLLMMALALGGALVAGFANPYLMLIAFALLFYPIGLYFFLTPGVFRWIGIFELLYLGAALVILSAHIAVILERRTRR